MPGSTNKRAEFSRIREKDPSGSWVQYQLAQGGPDYYAYHFNWLNMNGRFEIWIDPINR